MNQGGHHAGIHSAGEPEHHPAVSHLTTDVGDGFIDEFLHGPVAATAAIPEAEFRQGRHIALRHFRPASFRSHFRRSFADCQHRQSQRGEFRHFFSCGSRNPIGADDDSDRLFGLQTFNGDRIRHHHRVDMAVANGAGDFLNILAAAVQQNDSFRSTFHEWFPVCCYDYLKCRNVSLTSSTRRNCSGVTSSGMPPESMSR